MVKESETGKTGKPPVSLEDIINGVKVFELNGESVTFEAVYLNADNLDDKFRFAQALIASGRYAKVPFLLNNFSRELGSDPVAQDLLDKLHLQAVETGQIASKTEEDQHAQESLIRTIENDQLIADLREHLPLPVMGAVANVYLFQGLTDEVKKEKLRSWVTKALLRPYLGDLAIRNPKTEELNVKDTIGTIPERIFQDADKAALNIIRNYFVQGCLRLFIESEDIGFKKMDEMIEKEESEVKKEFLRGIRQEFEAIRNFPVPQSFKNSIENGSEPSPFPLFRQKYFAYYFRESRRQLLNGDTGATKTACAYLAMETLGAKKVTVVGPAIARRTWPKEAEKLFKEDQKPDVFTIERSSDLTDSRIETAQYVFIGSELLARALKDYSLRSQIEEALIQRRGTDALVFDESDDFKNEKAKGSQMIMDLATTIRNKHERETGKKLPMLALTATPISTDLDDLDVTMALLYPDKFALPGFDEDDKLYFSRQALKDPKIAHSLLFGEQLLTQWVLEDLFGDKVPKLQYERIQIPMSAFENVLYKWISNLPIDSLTKIDLLRSTLMNPELIKQRIKNLQLIPEPAYPKDELSKHLSELESEYLNWMIKKDKNIPDEPFSAEWIAKFGDEDFLIQCFFDETLVADVETLASRNESINSHWQKREDVSTKFKYVKNFLQSRIRKENGHYESSEKIFIVSPHHRLGVTRWMEDEKTKDSDLEDNTLSLYELVRSEWLPNLPNDASINIDGRHTFRYRDNHSVTFRERGDKDLIVVASIGAVSESMDWAIRDTDDNKNIESGTAIFLGWPWGWDDFKQMSGRFFRPGLAKPFNVIVLESAETIDEGFHDLVKRKYLLTQMALAGVELDQEDLEFFRRATAAKKILISEPNVGQRFLRDAIRMYKGKGEDEILESLAQQNDGLDWARYYFDEGRDEFRTVGNNAELVKNIILSLKPEQVLSIGAGTCLVSRKIAKESQDIHVDNIDLNAEVLRIAKDLFPQIGSVAVERASNLSANNDQYDVVDCSFMLPWTKIFDQPQNRITKNPEHIERVRVLAEINRVLKTGGHAVLTFPEGTFDPESFDRFTQEIEKSFGFKALNIKGLTYAVDYHPKKRLGWILTLEKIAEPNMNAVDPRNLIFADDLPRISHVREEEEGTKIVKIESNIFSSKEFEIEDPFTGEVSTLKTHARRLLTDEKRSTADIKAMLSDQEREIWVHCRRRLETALSQNYPQAEETLMDIIIRRGLDEPCLWQGEMMMKIMSVEINRIKRNGGETN